MRWLLLAVLLAASPSDAASVRCAEHMPCALTITFTGTIVPTQSLKVNTNNGVLFAESSCSGMSECSEPQTAIGLYDRNVLQVVVTVLPDGRLQSYHLGGRLVWIDQSKTRIASR